MDLSESINRLEIWNARVLREAFPQARHIAVMGNGPVDEEDARAVAEADVVIRQNNWGSRKELKADQLPVLGGRCDIFVGNWDIHTTNMGTEVDHPRMAVMGIPYPHRAGDADKLAHKYYHPDQTPYLTTVHPFWLRDCCRVLRLESDGITHPMPTVGMTTIYSLWRMMPDLPLLDRITVGGYTWRIDSTPPVQGAPGGNHAYPWEALWCARTVLRDPYWRFTSIPKEILERMERWYVDGQLPWSKRG